MYSDYNYSMTTSSYSPGFTFVCWAVAIFFAFVMWRIFTKADKPGWASIVPIYNLVVLFQIANLNPLMIFLLMIPFVNFVVLIMLYIKLAEAFGKGAGFGIGLIFLGFIFLPILAFGDAEYQG